MYPQGKVYLSYDFLTIVKWEIRFLVIGKLHEMLP